MKTAVEWLEDKINDELEIYNNQWLLIENFIEQAKKMEKEQIMKAYIKGAEAEINNPYVTNIEYYNKTFKN